MKPPETWDTDRLRLRRSGVEDAAPIFAAYAQDFEVSMYLAWKPTGNIEDTRAHLRAGTVLWEEGKAFQRVILRKNDSQLLGALGLRVNGHRLRLAYVLAKKFWSVGVPEY